MMSAPGKLVLAGEYAVLDRHPGLVMAVNRRVVLNPASKPSYSELWNWIADGKQEPLFQVDSSALYYNKIKLGLGSSAAVAVCMSAYFSPTEIYERAFQAHRQFSGGVGSGIDIAASYYGGLLRFQNGVATKLEPKFDSSMLLCVFSKKSQKTSDFVGKVLASKDSKLMAELGALTATWQDLFTRTWDWCVLRELVKTNLSLLGKLSERAQISLLTPEFEQISELASTYGASVKPSGAGGGDVTLCFVLPENREGLSRSLEQTGFLPLELDYFAEGLDRVLEF